MPPPINRRPMQTMDKPMNQQNPNLYKPCTSTAITLANWVDLQKANASPPGGGAGGFGGASLRAAKFTIKTPNGDTLDICSKYTQTFLVSVRGIQERHTWDICSN